MSHDTYQNIDRAEHGHQTLLAYYGHEYCGVEDPDTVLTDCLADLMHHARDIGTDWEACINRATMHYDAEVCPDDIEASYRASLQEGTYPMSLRDDLIREWEAYQSGLRSQHGRFGTDREEAGFWLQYPAPLSLFVFNHPETPLPAEVVGIRRWIVEALWQEEPDPC